MFIALFGSGFQHKTDGTWPLSCKTNFFSTFIPFFRYSELLSNYYFVFQEVIFLCSINVAEAIDTGNSSY